MNVKRIIPILFYKFSGLFPNLAVKLAMKIFCYPGRVKRRDEEHILLQSATQIKFASGRIGQYWGDGPVIFLCHGWGSRGTRFFNLIYRLLNHGFRVVVWDAPAHGYSPGKRTHLPAIAEALVEDLESSSIEPIAFVGHSMGGAVLGIIDKYYRKLPNKVVIVAAPTRIMDIFERYMDMLQLREIAKQVFIEKAQSLTGYHPRELSLVSSDLGQNKTVLVIHDEGDKEVPYSDFVTLKNHWNGSIFETTQNLGHRRILDDDIVLSKIVNYIKASPSKLAA